MFSILPVAVGCTGCCGAALCATQAAAPARAPRWTEKADMTWEGIFRFGFGSMIPTLKVVAAQVGEQKFYEMLRQAGSEAATKSAAGRPAGKRDFATWVAGMKSPNALFDHALVVDIIEETATSIDTRVRQCLWAKTFRGADAAEIGYAMICHPDFASARAFNPKMKLIRTKTLMQGDEYCNHRWVMES